MDKITAMQAGGLKLAEIIHKLQVMAKPGVNTLEIEEKAQKLIKGTGGQASFMMVHGYKHATCININSGLVHGIPRNYFFQEGDLVNIDIGLFYQGFHTDLAKSFIIGKKIDLEKKKFLKTGEETLKAVLAMIKDGVRVGEISWKIQQLIEKDNYYPARNYTGHGIGKKMHQSPFIPCVLTDKIENTPVLRCQDTVAIEIIYTKSGFATRVLTDGWTVVTTNGLWGACFEKTVAVGKDKAIILTDW